MIHFHDTTEKKETAEILSSPVLKDIKADTMTPQEAYSFWDGIFSAEPTNTRELTMDDLLTEIYGRSEDEFAFDGELTPAIQAVLAKFEVANWEVLNDAEKVAAVNELTQVIGKDLVLENIPEISFFEGPVTAQGAYDPADHSIGINRLLLDDPHSLVDTVAHEMRHAYQQERAMKQETWMDLLYAVNLDSENYISPKQLADGSYLFFTDYYNQLVEAEARAYADQFQIEEVER